MVRAGTCVAVVLLVGCTMLNPAYDELATESRAELGDADTRGDGDGDGDSGESGEGSSDSGDGDGDGDESDTGTACPPELGECEGLCVNLDEDPDNCGACGLQCGEHQVCALGDCVASKYVFVTSTRSIGAMAGIEGAHEVCQTRASEARLPGDYLAWLSHMQKGPAEAQSQIGPYVRRDGTIIAHTWDDLIDGQLDAPIDLDEFGAPIDPAPASSCQLEYAVWTGTTNDGQWAGDTCGDWTLIPNVELVGNVGDAKSVDAWSTSGLCSEICNLMLPIYCVQQ